MLYTARYVSATMKRGDFADLVTSSLTSDVTIMDSVVDMSWNSTGKSLLVRVQPVDQDAWKDIGTQIVESIRTLAEKVRIKAAYQLLSVNGLKNIVFAITPQAT